MKQTNPKSCECLKRPKVAMREFAATIAENMNWLASLQNPVLNTGCMQQAKELQPFLNALVHLNTRNVNATPDSAHIRTVFKTFYDPNLSVHSLMKDFYEIRVATYNTGIHFMTAVELISHPAEYTDKMVGVDEPTTAFKQDRIVAALSQFLNATCTNCLRSPGSTKSVTRNLLDELCSTYQLTR